MTTKLINGRLIARKILADLSAELAGQKTRPGLAIVLVGSDPSSEVYVRVKERACRQLRITFALHRLPQHVLERNIIDLIAKLNADSDVHGIVVQLPLPRHLNEDAIIGAIDWRKDVDGFHPTNLAHYLEKRSVEPPGLIRGIVALLKSTRVGLRGKQAAILANADAFTKPLAQALNQKGMTATIVKTGLPYRPVTSQADVVVIAYGDPGLIKGRDIKPGSILIDVGINRLPDKTIVGDVDVESVSGIAGWLTPVPGGVGPVTVAMLLEGTVKAYQHQLAVQQIGRYP